MVSTSGAREKGRTLRQGSLPMLGEPRRFRAVATASRPWLRVLLLGLIACSPLGAATSGAVQQVVTADKVERLAKPLRLGTSPSGFRGKLDLLRLSAQVPGRGALFEYRLVLQLSGQKWALSDQLVLEGDTAKVLLDRVEGQIGARPKLHNAYGIENRAQPGGARIEEQRVFEISARQLLSLAQTKGLKVTVRGSAGWDSVHQVDAKQIARWNRWIAEMVRATGEP